MTIGDAVRERLLDMTPLTTLISDRVFAMVLRQGEKRGSVRYQVIDENALQHLRGPAGIQTTRVQIDSYVSVKDSTTPLTDVEAIADAVHGNGLGTEANGLFGFIGNLGGSPGEIRILNARRAMKRGPLYEYDDDVIRLRVQQDYWVDWKTL